MYESQVSNTNKDRIAIFNIYSKLVWNFLRCCFKLIFCVNCCWHSIHWNCFSPVCTTIWRLTWALLGNNLKQTRHCWNFANAAPVIKKNTVNWSYWIVLLHTFYMIGYYMRWYVILHKLLCDIYGILHELLCDLTQVVMWYIYIYGILHELLCDIYGILHKLLCDIYTLNITMNLWQFHSSGNDNVFIPRT